MALQKIHTARPVGQKGFGSNVDIIVPFHGHYDGVAKLVESIFRCTHSNRYQITLVDDCSPNDGFIESLSKVDVLKCVRTPTHLGFGGAMKYGFTQTEQPYVVFVNSDCLVEDVGWLKTMGDSLMNLKAQGVRMVSPRTNNAGNGDPRQECEKAAMSVDDIVLDETHLSMYCFMCHRELFNRVGGFIKDYPYGWYEDEEFAHRMKKHGFKQAICGKGWIYHEGGCTTKDLWRKSHDIRRIMSVDNRLKCVDDIKALQNQ